MLLLFKLHNIQSLWGLSFTLFMWLGQTHLARFMENLRWFGELEQQEGILSCSFSCPWLFWNCRKRHSICVAYGVRNTGFLMVRKHLSSSCWTQEVVFCFPPQICCTSLSLSSTLLKGLNKGVKGAWEWDYELLFFSTALCIWLLIVMLQMVQLEIHPFFGCQNVPVQSLMVNGKEMGECWIALCMFASSSCFEHNQKPRLFIYLKKVC